MRVAERVAINSFPKDYRFPKVARIRDRKEFSLVRQSGEVYTSRNFTLRHLKRVEGHSLQVPKEILRLGISFYPRTKSSVVRNRVKRIFREIFRTEKENLTPGIDLHISVKPQESARGVVFSVLREEFISICQKANIWI